MAKLSTAVPCKGEARQGVAQARRSDERNVQQRHRKATHAHSEGKAMTRIEIQDADSVDPEVWLRAMSAFLREHLPDHHVTNIVYDPESGGKTTIYVRRKEVGRETD